MHCISCTLKRKVEKYLLFKQTLKSRFTCLACQHFSFDAKKSLDRERPFSLALRVVSLFSCLSRLAPSVTRVAICVSRVLLEGLQKKRETASSLFHTPVDRIFSISSIILGTNVHNSSKYTTMIHAQLFQCPFNNSKSISCV